MYIDSQTIDESWEASESKKIADRLVQDVVQNSLAFTRFVRFNDQAFPPTRNSTSKRVNRAYIELRLSLEDIHRKMKDSGDISKSNDCLLSSLQHDAFLEMAEALNREYPDHHFERSGLILYKPGNYLGWHTNSTNPINRVYFVYSDKGDSSFLRYDHATNQIREDKDRPGWNIREFEAGDGIEDPLYWHAVYSYCTRISIGFRVTPANRDVAIDTAFRNGRHHLFENEWAAGLDLSPLPSGRRYAVPIRSLAHLLTPDRLQECRLREIAFQPSSGKSKPGLLPSDESIPGIVARNMVNPFGKPYRLIDGSARIERLKSEGVSSAPFYVLTFREVMQHLVVQDSA
jgi:hypothetical protein